MAPARRPYDAMPVAAVVLVALATAATLKDAERLLVKHAGVTHWTSRGIASSATQPPPA